MQGTVPLRRIAIGIAIGTTASLAFSGTALADGGVGVPGMPTVGGTVSEPTPGQVSSTVPGVTDALSDTVESTSQSLPADAPTAALGEPLSDAVEPVAASVTGIAAELEETVVEPAAGRASDVVAGAIATEDAVHGVVRDVNAAVDETTQPVVGVADTAAAVVVASSEVAARSAPNEPISTAQPVDAQPHAASSAPSELQTGGVQQPAQDVVFRSGPRGSSPRARPDLPRSGSLAGSRSDFPVTAPAVVGDGTPEVGRSATGAAPARHRAPEIPPGTPRGLAPGAASSGGSSPLFLAALVAALTLAAPGLGRWLRPAIAPWPLPIPLPSLERPG